MKIVEDVTEYSIPDVFFYAGWLVFFGTGLTIAVLYDRVFYVSNT